MRISESMIRRIIREEAQRALREDAPAAFKLSSGGGFGGGGDDDGGDDGGDRWEPEPHDPGPSNKWWGGYSDEVPVELDSSDESLNEEYFRWAVATVALFERAGSRSFEMYDQMEGGKNDFTVHEMMKMVVDEVPGFLDERGT